MNGLEATRLIREMLPEAAVIIVSQHAGDAYVERACAAGARAYVLKNRVHDDLEPLLAGILAGNDARRPHGTEDDRCARR